MQMWKKRTMVKQQATEDEGEKATREQAAGNRPHPQGAAINASVINPPLNF
jgi:hypothetical protein